MFKFYLLTILLGVSPMESDGTVHLDAPENLQPLSLQPYPDQLTCLQFMSERLPKAQAMIVDAIARGSFGEDQVHVRIARADCVPVSILTDSHPKLDDAVETRQPVPVD